MSLAETTNALDLVTLWERLQAEIEHGRITLEDARAALPDTIDYAAGVQYVVYSADLNSLYDAVPRAPVVMLYTRNKAHAHNAMNVLCAHNIAAWFVPERDADTEERFERTRRIRFDTLHVGDRVILWFNCRTPQALRVVTITRVIARDDYSATGERVQPLIEWTADPECSEDWYRRTDGTLQPMAHCDASYVVAVLQRAPWRTDTSGAVDNVYARCDTRGRPLHDFADHVEYRTRGHVACHPYQLAQCILGARPTLHVPERLETMRFWKAWERVQYPGWRGMYAYDGNRIVAELSTPFATRSQFGFPQTTTWINLKTFTRWLLRVYPTLLETRMEIRTRLIASAREEERQYARDMGYAANHDDDDHDTENYDDTDSYDDYGYHEFDRD